MFDKILSAGASFVGNLFKGGGGSSGGSGVNVIQEPKDISDVLTGIRRLHSNNKPVQKSEKTKKVKNQSDELAEYFYELTKGITSDG